MAIDVVAVSQVSDDLGYTTWTWIPLVNPQNLSNANATPYAEIPKNLLPASESQVAFETATCALSAPWGGFADPYSEYSLGGGYSGTLLGALNGLSIVEQTFEQPQSATYGLGDNIWDLKWGIVLEVFIKKRCIVGFRHLI